MCCTDLAYGTRNTRPPPQVAGSLPVSATVRGTELACEVYDCTVCCTERATKRANGGDRCAVFGTELAYGGTEMSTVCSTEIAYGGTELSTVCSIEIAYVGTELSTVCSTEIAYGGTELSTVCSTEIAYGGGQVCGGCSSGSFSLAAA
eukprot:3297562-Rhodomonas_salina.1